MIDFTLDAKNGGSNDVWIGQSSSINHRDMTDFYGNPLDTIYQSSYDGPLIIKP
jgi:hypothetical protein